MLSGKPRFLSTKKNYLHIMISEQETVIEDIKKHTDTQERISLNNVVVLSPRNKWQEKRQYIYRQINGHLVNRHHQSAIEFY